MKMFMCVLKVEYAHEQTGKTRTTHINTTAHRQRIAEKKKKGSRTRVLRWIDIE